jgi:FxsC-like protein
MPYKVFLSYSRVDSQNSRLIDFYAALRSRLRVKIKGLTDEEAIFFDQSSIELAADWSHEIEEALRTSDFFIALLSPNYVYSKYCGKEFEAFSSRVVDPNKPRIMPLIWETSTDPLPDVIASKQWDNLDMPPAYKEDGLSIVTKLSDSRYKDEYVIALEAIADRIAAATKTPLEPGPSLPPFSQMKSAFHRDERVANAAEVGPSNARFAFVAATPSEIEELRKRAGADVAMLALRDDMASYGFDGAWWQPYFPPEKDAYVGKIAVEEAKRLKLNPEELAVRPNLVARVKAAAAQNNLVAVLVDPCSLEIESYRSELRDLDEFASPHYTILVAWNTTDASMARHDERLRLLIRDTFPGHSVAANATYFQPRIEKLLDFRDQLKRSLAELRAHVHETAEVARKVSSSKAPIVNGPGAS